MALDHSTAVPLLMIGALFVGGMIALSVQSSKHQAIIETRRKRARAGENWVKARGEAGGLDPVSELLIALSHCFAIRAGLTPLGHDAYSVDTLFERQDSDWTFRWGWRTFTDPEREERMHADIEGRFISRHDMPFLVRRSTCLPDWLEKAVLERSRVDGVHAVYEHQKLCVHAIEQRPSAHLVLAATAKLREMLPPGMDPDEALDSIAPKP